MVSPDQEADKRDTQAREGDRLVPEDLLMRESRDRLADNRHAGKNHDVDRRMRIEPEEMLEQHRVATQRRIENADTKKPFENQQHQRNRQAPALPESE